MAKYNQFAHKLSDRLGGGPAHSMQLFRVEYDYEVFVSMYERGKLIWRSTGDIRHGSMWQRHDSKTPVNHALMKENVEHQIFYDSECEHRLVEGSIQYNRSLDLSSFVTSPCALTADTPMFGTTRLSLSLYGANVLQETGNCVLSYLTKHFAAPHHEPNVTRILRIIEKSGRFFNKIKHHQCELVIQYETRPSLDLLNQLIDKYGLRPKDISVVSHHFTAKVYILDLQGSILYVYKPETLKKDHKYGPVVAVHYEKHFYPVTDPSIINSIAQRSISLWDKDPTLGKVDPCRSSVTMVNKSKTHKARLAPRDWRANY